MEFSPFNNVVKHCLQGMNLEENGRPEEALKRFQQAWAEATNDHEKFLAAYYIARQQKTVADNLRWLQTTLELAQKVNDDAVNSTLPSLYRNIARCYRDLNNFGKATAYTSLADSVQNNPSDKGPFYHGTKAGLHVGDLLTPGGVSNYKPGIQMNHIYFTALLQGAGLAAALAKGDGPERVYQVEPTGAFENDPNLTDQKFPGNPSRSYRSVFPLEIVAEVTDWTRPAPEDLQKFREKVAESKGDIIN